MKTTTKNLSLQKLRNIFNERRHWTEPDFDQTVKFVNEGKHGSWMKLKKLIKELNYV